MLMIFSETFDVKYFNNKKKNLWPFSTPGILLELEFKDCEGICTIPVKLISKCI